MTQGCFAVILDETKNKVLLVKRTDFPVWDLPGGKLEHSETLEHCVIRETAEETGYIIRVEPRIGEYLKPQFSDVQHIFIGTIIDGEPTCKGLETSNLKWFNISNLPLLMVPNRRKQIQECSKTTVFINRTLHTNKLVKKLIEILRT